MAPRGKEAERGKRAPDHRAKSSGLAVFTKDKHFWFGDLPLIRESAIAGVRKKVPQKVQKCEVPGKDSSKVSIGDHSGAPPLIGK